MSDLSFEHAIVRAARGWLGTPYHHQQSVKGHGTDCLGLVRGVWREICGPEVEAIPNYGSSWKTGEEDVLLKVDLSRFSAAPSSHLSGKPFESQGAFPA
ncbi:MAG: hypothetical protein GQ535_14880 [Rhodobacteraceae bacterium]|nr:hypothetical protein [Paracoccaceae bacterium]